MSARHHRPSVDESIQARAAAWLAEADEGLSAEREAAFQAWVSESPMHAAAVARLDRSWKRLRLLETYRPEARMHPDPDLLRPRPPRRRSSWPTGVGLAIAAALAVALIAFWRPPESVVPAPVPGAPTYATTQGGYQRLTLPDGSVAELNADTEVRVDYQASVRRIVLVRGEVHVTVARAPERPFWVEAQGVQVRAVGTAFDVRLSRKEVEVLVTAGQVELLPEDRTGPAEPLAQTRLTAGWRAVLSAQTAANVRVERMDPEDVRSRLAWQGARLTFADMPLAEVIEQFNLRNRVQLRLEDDTLGNVPVVGSFEAGNVEAFVRLLCSNGDIAASRTGDGWVVLKRRGDRRSIAPDKGDK